MYSKALSNNAHAVLMANAREAQFRCLYCKKIFISQIYLQRHETRRHSVLPSNQGEEPKSDKNIEGPTIKAVLNAAERIEDLLFKLAFKESEKKNGLSLDTSSPGNIIENNSLAAFNPSLTEKSVTASDNSNQSSNEKCKKFVSELKYHDFLDEDENGAFLKLTSAAETCANSNLVLNPIVQIVNEQQADQRTDTISFLEDSFSRSSIDCHLRLKDEVITKLNNRLKLYGIHCDQETLSDKELSRIEQLILNERDQIAENRPEYYKLRDLIKDNAESRIEENIRSRSLHAA